MSKMLPLTSGHESGCRMNSGKCKSSAACTETLHASVSANGYLRYACRKWNKYTFFRSLYFCTLRFIIKTEAKTGAKTGKIHLVLSSEHVHNAGFHISRRWYQLCKMFTKPACTYTRMHTQTGHVECWCWSASPWGPIWSVWLFANSWWEPASERLESEVWLSASISTVAVNLNPRSFSPLEQLSNVFPVCCEGLLWGSSGGHQSKI